MKKRIERILTLLQRYYPDAECALNHNSPEQLLIATVLSAQCTDARVNLVTPTLFKKYPTMVALANADLPELENIIRSTGFFRNKAKNLKAMAQGLVQDHHGRVPKDLDALVALPGVGRKTANVVLGNSFAMATGIVVDTHVSRLSFRLGLSKAKSAEAIEADLMKIVPKEHWIQFSHWLITHGRTVCKARTPACEVCFLAEDCPKNGVTVRKPIRENRK